VVEKENEGYSISTYKFNIMSVYVKMAVNGFV